MAEEQGLSGGNWTPSEIVRLWAFEVCGKRIHYSTAQRLVNQLNAARSEGPLPVGGEGGSIRGDEPSSDASVSASPAAFDAALAAMQRFTLKRAPDGFRLFMGERRIEGPWAFREAYLAEARLLEVQLAAALAAGQSLNGQAQDGSSHKNDEANPVVRTTPNLPPRAKP